MYTRGMRYMGIDYGTRRVGIALSDAEARMAFPEAVFKNTDTLPDQVLEMAQEKKVATIVIGESKDFKGNDNSIMDAVREFASKLEKNGLVVLFEPEFLTSHQAAQTQGETAMHDASAAAIILTSFLSRQQ